MPVIRGTDQVGAQQLDHGNDPYPAGDILVQKGQHKETIRRPPSAMPNELWSHPGIPIVAASCRSRSVTAQRNLVVAGWIGSSNVIAK